MSVSKTPQFDELLDSILEELIPHERLCVDCDRNFIIYKEDIDFYKMLRVPPPTHCPGCRNRRRLSFANYSNIYKRKCDVPGHTDVMISPIAPVMPWVTYDYETYYSDKWDPMSYGLNIKSKISFFNQFMDLLKEIPQPGVRRGSDSPNSDYSFYGKYMKDCYYVFGGRTSEDVMFSSSIYRSIHVMDSYFTREVDTGYENITTNKCNNCFFTYFSSNCFDCRFIYDCRNCNDCFGCVNLRNKKYCWFNEQLSKEEYSKRINEIDLTSQDVNNEIRNKFFDLVKDNPIRATRVQNSENVLGNDIKNSSNCFDVFQAEDSENLRYAYFVIMYMTNSMDVNHGGRGDNLYETQNAAHSSNIKFSFAVKESSDSEFLITATNCHNCFGCVGLKNASYCIFNKQYSPEEYFIEVDKIKTEMLRNGEYGEFFPMNFSPIAYNSSFANIMYPMSEEEAKERKLFWQPDVITDLKSLKVINASDLPKTLSEVTEDLYDVAIIGESSKKSFRIIKREVDFYKRYKIPLPTDTPYSRMMKRFRILNNFCLEKDTCSKCKIEIHSAYKTTDGYKPYCEKCYQQEVI